MRKIAIITPFLANGGLEKVAVVGAEELSKYYDVTLIVMDSYQIDYPYTGKTIDLNISLLDRNIVKRLYNLVLGAWRLFCIKKSNAFDLVISHGELASLPNIISGRSNNIIVVHENRFAAFKDLQGKIVNKIIQYIYSVESTVKIVTVSQGIEESFRSVLGIKEEKLQTIYNPYDINEIERLSKECITEYALLFEHDVIMLTGRLSFQKGQWYALRTFKKLKDRNRDLRLVILGDGELRDRLIELSKDLGLKTYSVWSNDTFEDDLDVYFLGFKKNPFKYMAASKLFMMTSLWEGFGNTIVEAMASGVPVVSTNCPSGPSEIIHPSLQINREITEVDYGGYGVLMPVFDNRFVDADASLDQNELLWSQTLTSLLNDKKALLSYRRSGRIQVERFQLGPIIHEWRILIENSLDGKIRT